jgi:hypothetical protein
MPDSADPNLPEQTPQPPPVLEGELLGDAPDEKPQPLPITVKNRRGQRRLENITVEAIEEFLANLAKTGVLYSSAEDCGLAYFTINRLRKEEPDFEAMVQDALEAYRDVLVKEAHRRAVEGWEEPVFSQKLGTEIGRIQRYDSKLLELLLKRHIPEFREKFEGEIKVTGGVLIAPAQPANTEEWLKQYGTGRQELIAAPEKPALPDHTPHTEK